MAPRARHLQDQVRHRTRRVLAMQRQARPHRLHHQDQDRPARIHRRSPRAHLTRRRRHARVQLEARPLLVQLSPRQQHARRVPHLKAVVTHEQHHAPMRTLQWAEHPRPSREVLHGYVQVRSRLHQTQGKPRQVPATGRPRERTVHTDRTQATCSPPLRFVRRPRLRQAGPRTRPVPASLCPVVPSTRTRHLPKLSLVRPQATSPSTGASSSQARGKRQHTDHSR
jgi:hypothetical protein